MFSRTRPHEPSAEERAAAPTYPEAVARAVAAIDGVLAHAATQDPGQRDWVLVNAALDERLKLRPIAPIVPGGEV